MKLGIIAGDGRLPVAFCQEAKASGHSVIAIGVIPEISPELRSYVDALYEIPVGKWDSIVQTLKQESISDLYMLGKVQKGLMYSNMEFDARFMKVMAGLNVRNDDAVVLGFIQDLAEEGITVRKQTELIEGLLAREGVLTSQAITEKDWADIRFGFRMAKGIAGLDIGQTVIVKDTAVVAVEAIEGTDRAIARGGELVGEGTVVVKVAKPNQDLRFDVPTIGLRTLESLLSVKAKVIAVEANATFVVDRERLIEKANAAGISIVAVR